MYRLHKKTIRNMQPRNTRAAQSSYSKGLLTIAAIMLLVPLSVGAFYLWYPTLLFWAVQALLLLCTVSVSILDSYLGRRHARQAAEAAARE